MPALVPSPAVPSAADAPFAPRRGRLAGKTAVVTGGTTGIGFETARQFLAEGARVLVTGQDASRVAAAKAQLGGDARAVLADVRRLDALDALAARVRHEFGAPDAEGGLDVLFANAGVGAFAPIERMSEAQFDEQFAVNVKGVYFTIQRLLPLLRPGASIIVNASAVNAKGAPNGSVYFATKAAVRSLVRSLAVELAPRRIRVNAISPGLVPTPFGGKTGMPPAALEAMVQRLTAATPLGRVGAAEEIAPAVVFLASDESSYVTAEDLVVDGGWMNV